MEDFPSGCLDVVELECEKKHVCKYIPRCGGVSFKKQKQMAALFLGGVIYKEKKKGERERKCVGLDGQQTSPEADFFFVFWFIFFWVDARCRHLGVWIVSCCSDNKFL